MEPDLSPPRRSLCVVAIFVGIPGVSPCEERGAGPPNHELLIIISGYVVYAKSSCDGSTSLSTFS